MRPHRWVPVRCKVHLGLAAVLPAIACATTRGDLEPRYVAVHNALAAVGLAQTGPLFQGSLAEGHDARFSLDLVAQCTTIAAVGGAGVKNLDVTLLDPEGKAVAHDTTEEPQAVLRACVDRPGRYALVVRAASGSGDFLASSWTGGIGGPAPSASALAISEAVGRGTCDAPLPLASGAVRGTTSRAEAQNEGSCAATSGPEVVYKLDLTARKHVVIDVDPRFDSVLYVRRGDCTDDASEIACNDDAPHEHDSRVDEVLEAGTYFVFVDGYQSASGAYKMTTTIEDAPTADEMCRRAPALAFGGRVSSTMQGAFDHVEATCGQGARGPDQAYRLELASRSRVRVSMRSNDFSPVVHLRKTCADESSEVACSDGALADHAAVVSRVLEPGSYGVFADAEARDGSGAFSIDAEVAPAQGSGVSGDACSDATPIGPKETEILGDTFLAKDDVTTTCGAPGGADVVYRIDVARKARLEVEIAHDEGDHVVALAHACGDRSAEIGCGPKVARVVSPGSYFLTVDAKKPESVGHFALRLALRDVAAQEAACRGAEELRVGETHATTAGGTDKFHPSCAGAGDTGPDRVYRFSVTRRARVHITVRAARFAPALSLRTACVDGASNGGELTCGAGTAPGGASIQADLVPGTYYVVVDGVGRGSEGPFNVEMRTTPLTP